MSIVVFLGPTMPSGEAAKILDARYLPPAAQGDLYLAVRDGARTIGIVDGYFQGAPSIWHKEVLWAMSRGVQVYGSSSMGALRAAELCDFGMQGVGRIFEAYRDGEITEDDEVAVVHGPREVGYRAATVPLVNMRATLGLALEQQVVSRGGYRTMIDTARSLFYWDRSYSALITKCQPLLEQTILRNFELWLRDNTVDQKRKDAIELLEHLRTLTVVPHRATYQFQQTRAWEDMVEDILARDEKKPMPPLRVTENRVLNEVKLEPLLYHRVVGASNAVASEAVAWGDSPGPLIDALLKSGFYEQLATRAEEKHNLLTSRYGFLPDFADAMMTPSEVVDWYFEDVCAMTVPMNLDEYARELGISTPGELCRLLLHELLYVLACEERDHQGIRQ